MTEPRATTSTSSGPDDAEMPLYRRVEPNMQLGEFRCEEFIGDLLFGKYQRK